jgi:hypothetical protein
MRDRMLGGSASRWGRSFKVEDFGTEGVRALTGQEISQRVSELARITQFVEQPVALSD